MQYRLRTLLVLLALGPMALAGGWFAGRLIYREFARTPVDEWFTLYPLGRGD